MSDVDESDQSSAGPLDLDELLDSDLDGLLDTPERVGKLAASDRLRRSFLEIVEFRREHGRPPSAVSRDIGERKLAARLDGILADEGKVAALVELDESELLVVPDAPDSLEDLLGAEDLDLLDDESGILDVTDLPMRRQVFDSAAAARREKARDFDRFEPLFKQKHAELREGAVKLVPYRGMSSIRQGKFFVLNGMMLFVAEVGYPEYKKTTVRENRRERLRCVFENGTESSMYRQSLGIRLSDEDGQAVIESGRTEILSDDQVSGYIYILRSRSEDPQIKSLNNLHKIGFTRGTVEARIKNAEKSPTYLMAPVEVVASYRTYNLKTSALENLLHRLFSDARLDLTQSDLKGRDQEPSEWFVVPHAVIDQAVDLILTGDIVRYKFDAQSQKLVEGAD